jgi:hypothetical protein
MSEVISSAANSPTFAEQQELKVAVAELFCVFKRKYGPRWKEQFEDAQARPVWFASLRAGGVTAAALKQGLASLSQVGNGWPPSDEEFIALCRPRAPTLDEALNEAGMWARDQSHKFSHAAIGAAARSVGSWNLRTLDDRSRRTAFGIAYRTALDRCARGEDLSVPIPKALPETVRNRIPPGAADPAAVVEARAKAARLLGLAL